MLLWPASVKQGFITGTKTANVAYMVSEIQKHWKNIWICVESTKLSILLCQLRTQKLNLQTGIKTFSVPLVIYVDAEAVSLKHETCRQNLDASYTLNKETQKPFAIGFCAVDKKGGSDYHSFEDEKCIE